MFDNEFNPVIRFLVVSDVHYKDEHSVERDRMTQAMKTAYKLSSEREYPNLDALYVVGDFANSGTRAQMEAFKKTVDENIKDGTELNLAMASHEYFSEGPEAAREKLRDIFNQEPNTHKIINGFHFISVSCTKGCDFEDDEKAFAEKALKEAAADSPEKPIFFFQHPHITDTVYGSIDWGEKDLYPILCNYPQIIDFSGHSHAPINDPRSVHQKNFTCFGTGTLSYFENDEFDMYYGTVVPGSDKAAQMLIVEADAQNRVRVYPYDLISDNFFPFVWKVDKPSDISSFIYTDDRYKTTDAPWFDDNAEAQMTVDGNNISVTFPQAKVKSEYVNSYKAYLKDKDGHIVRNKNFWSEYYFYDMPEKLTVDFNDVEAGEYYVEIYACSFWKTTSEKPLKTKNVII